MEDPNDASVIARRNAAMYRKHRRKPGSDYEFAASVNMSESSRKAFGVPPAGTYDRPGINPREVRDAANTAWPTRADWHARDENFRPELDRAIASDEIARTVADSAEILSGLAESDVIGSTPEAEAAYDEFQRRATMQSAADSLLAGATTGVPAIDQQIIEAAYGDVTGLPKRFEDANRTADAAVLSGDETTCGGDTPSVPMKIPEGFYEAGGYLHRLNPELFEPPKSLEGREAPLPKDPKEFTQELVKRTLKITRNLRTHAPRQGARPTIVISGDGSREGTRAEFEGTNAIGPILRISVTLDWQSETLAPGVATCMVDGAEKAFQVWVRFGEHRKPIVIDQESE